MEGYFDDSVKIRRILVGDSRVEGSVALDFSELVQVSQEVDEMPEKRYNSIEELPEWARPAIRKLMDEGKLQGNGQGLDLSLDMVRVMVVLSR